MLTDYSPGLKNSDVALYAIREARVVVTLDSDFLKLRNDLQQRVKVILIRVDPAYSEMILKVLSQYLAKALQHLRKRNVVILSESGIIESGAP